MSRAASFALFYPAGMGYYFFTIMQFVSTSQHGRDHKRQTENNDHKWCGLANGGWLWLFLFICFLPGPSSSQLSAWLSGGGSLPQYIWIPRLLLFGYESWIPFAFPSGDAGCQLLWLQYTAAQRDTLWDKFDQWDLFLLSAFLPLTKAVLVGPSPLSLLSALWIDPVLCREHWRFKSRVE